MPPKKQEVSKKTETKKKEKIVEDKTFGMKNKKGAKQQKFIQTVQQQVSQMGRSAKQMSQAEREKMERQSKKEEKKKALEELNMLFKPVEQKVSKGTDPKSVLCAFFKAGQCTKGDKCKFSHDLAIERRCEKRSLYEDLRDDSDDMNNWDEAKLVEVINKKHGEQEKVKPKTAIVCKFFLEAVETNKYGWFWSCPSGDGCIYRHCLPPGFTLKKDKKKEEKNDMISLEDLIEKERAALNTQNLTRVCLESFLKWKEQKKQEKIKNAMAATEKKKTNFAAGKMLGISGRELFEFNPDLIRGDDDEADEGSMYNGREGEDEEVEYEVVREICFDTFAESGQDYVELPQQSRLLNAPTSNGPCQVNGKGDDSENEEIEGATGNAPEIDEPIDENLFDGEDLDVVDEELGNLNMDG